jgi:molybdenum cofactor synthesis domain-containing protein
VTDFSPKIYCAALLVIGNEILTGRTQDTNTQWIAEKLGPHGIALREVRVVPDEECSIIATIKDMKDKFDYILTTGGIGPTHDDITTECIAKAFGVKTVLNDDARQRLLNYYGSETELTGPRLKMAHIPEGATLIDNPVSAAPGFVIGNVYVMAGVPRIMQAMLDHVLSMLAQGTPYLSNTISCMMAESKIAEDLSSLQQRYAEIIIGSYPHYRGGVLGLSLVLRGVDRIKLQTATDELIDLIRKHGDEPRAISLQSKAI